MLSLHHLYGTSLSPCLYHPPSRSLLFYIFTHIFSSLPRQALGANVISIYEDDGAGLTWSNLSSPVSVDDSFTFATVLGMLIWDTIFYGILTWCVTDIAQTRRCNLTTTCDADRYIEGVFPGEFGIPRKWYFPITVSSLPQPGLFLFGGVLIRHFVANLLVWSTRCPSPR